VLCPREPVALAPLEPPPDVFPPALFAPDEAAPVVPAAAVAEVRPPTFDDGATGLVVVLTDPAPELATRLAEEAPGLPVLADEVPEFAAAASNVVAGPTGTTLVLAAAAEVVTAWAVPPPEAGPPPAPPIMLMTLQKSRNCWNLG
jgi:hypothetical protein